MHLPFEHAEQGLKVTFLGTWDTDEGSYAVSDTEGNIELKTFR
jgi:hypothetical protein